MSALLVASIPREISKRSLIVRAAGRRRQSCCRRDDDAKLGRRNRGDLLYANAFSLVIYRGNEDSKDRHPSGRRACSVTRSFVASSASWIGRPGGRAGRVHRLRQKGQALTNGSNANKGLIISAPLLAFQGGRISQTRRLSGEGARKENPRNTKAFFEARHSTKAATCVPSGPPAESSSGMKSATSTAIFPGVSRFALIYFPIL